MDPMAAIRDTFFQECEEQLGALETGLLMMEGGDCDSETVNAVFRAVHSVKGGAGAFGLDALVRFAHVFETALDDVRAGRLAPDGRVLGVMLRAADALADLDESVGGAAALVASELAANAIDHVGSPFRVTMRRSNGTVTVAVEDLSPAKPERVNAAVDAIRGRGLRIIDELCSRWGTDIGPNGKVVWAELAPA